MASAAVTEMLPVAEAPERDEAQEVPVQDEEEQRHHVGHELLSAVTDVGQGDIVPQVQVEGLEEVQYPAGRVAARVRPPLALLAARPTVRMVRRLASIRKMTCFVGDRSISNPPTRIGGILRGSRLMTSRSRTRDSPNPRCGGSWSRCPTPRRAHPPIPAEPGVRETSRPPARRPGGA